MRVRFPPVALARTVARDRAAVLRSAEWFAWKNCAPIVPLSQ